MNISVKKLEYDELYGEQEEESSEVIRRRVETAQKVQKRRLEPYHILYNSQIPSNVLEEVCQLGKEEKELRQEIFECYDLSARGASKLLKVARTIADLSYSEKVTCEHLWEALSYRMPDFGDLSKKSGAFNLKQQVKDAV
jgi:magnesium chelatase family protein